MSNRNCGRSNKARKVSGILILLALVCYFLPPVQQIVSLPQSITLSEGNSLALEFGLPVDISESGDSEYMTVALSADQRLNTVRALAQGSALLDLKVFGVTVRTVNVSVLPERVLIPGGQNIGVAMRTQGVMVIGSSQVATAYGDVNPALNAGLKSGDRIIGVNGVEVGSTSELSQLINDCGGETLSLTVIRNDAVCEFTLSPALDPHDNAYRIGAWVRDSTAGVGTLSFYDPRTGAYGALGHAICDIDTGERLAIGEGEILRSEVVDIRSGHKGDPGELRGAFITRAERLGNIVANSDYGIYGRMYAPVASEMYPEGLPVASRALVHVGPARLITTLDSRGERAYDCEIVRVVQNNRPETRSMTIKITDPELLSLTGGIVQGMSGSPIIQDERLVGAITHVFVNDPTQGYGIFAQTMLEQADMIAADAA